MVEAIERRGAKCKLSDRDFEYESLEELKKNQPNAVKGLELESRFPQSYERLTVEFRRGGIRLVSDRTESLLLLWHELREIISHRSPWYLQVFSWPYTPAVAAPLLFGTTWLTDHTTLSPTSARSATAFILFLALMTLISAVSSLLRPTVYLRKQHEVESFASRNAEKLTVGVVGAVLGALAKAVVDHLAK